MHHEHAGWHSPSLDKYMHLQIIGHAGARVLVFPTTMGTHSEWPDRRMHEVLREHLDNGWIQMYCLDQVHDESWYGKHLHPGAMAWRHLQYLNYVAEEVLPFSRSKNDNGFVIATGASFGAYHAASFGFRYPERVHRIIGMSGNYDIKRFTGGYSDDNVYACNPYDFMQHEHDPGRLAAFKRRTSFSRSARATRCSRTIGRSPESSGRRALATRFGSGTATRTTGRTGKQ